MIIQLIGVGVCLIALGLVHIIFPKQFNWKEELRSLSIINREMVYVHTFFIALTLILIGLLCITCTNDVLATALGHKVALGLGIFFSLRFAAQFIGYSSNTWKGKTLETSIHILFSVFWLYVSLLFLYIFFS